MSREIDALVAEHVFAGLWLRGGGATEFLSVRLPHVVSGRVNVATRVEGLGVSANAYLPNHSTSIQEAWLVVDRMREQGWLLDLHVPTNAPWGDRMKYKAHFARYDVLDARADEHGIEHADTAPMAICLAALKAHGITPDSTVPSSSVGIGESK